MRCGRGISTCEKLLRSARTIGFSSPIDRCVWKRRAPSSMYLPNRNCRGAWTWWIGQPRATRSAASSNVTRWWCGRAQVGRKPSCAVACRRVDTYLPVLGRPRALSDVAAQAPPDSAAVSADTRTRPPPTVAAVNAASPCAFHQHRGIGSRFGSAGARSPAATVRVHTSGGKP